MRLSLVPLVLSFTEGLVADVGSDSTGSSTQGIPKRAVGRLGHVMQPTSTVVTSPDVQAQRPTVHVSLSRVGVTNVEKVIRISREGREELYWAKLECFVDLGPKQKGAHMSRFEETVNDVIGEVILGESAFRAETLAERVATIVRERQGAARAEVKHGEDVAHRRDDFRDAFARRSVLLE